MNGILGIFRTGAPWRDLPEEFCAWQTVWRLFDEWNGNGTLDFAQKNRSLKFAAICSPRRGEEPVPWPIALAGDKGYRADGIDVCLMAIGISPGRRDTEFSRLVSLNSLRCFSISTTRRSIIERKPLKRSCSSSWKNTA
jgi:hypothetical protein